MLGLFSGEIIFGRIYYWKEFFVSKWVGVDNKNSLKHEKSLKKLKTTNPNSPWAYIREGLLSEQFFRLRFVGLICGRAFFLVPGHKHQSEHSLLLVLMHKFGHRAWIWALVAEVVH